MSDETKLPPDVERAKGYIGIFHSLGDRWRECVPVDGQLNGDRLRLGSVELWPDGDCWRITDGAQVWGFRRAEADR